MSRFYKLSGSGNDFLALAEPSQAPGPETIRAWCAKFGPSYAAGLRRGAHVRMTNGTSMRYY